MPGVKGQRRMNRKQPVARDRIWQSMRVLREFTVPDLVATAESSESNAYKYVLGLSLSGYVRRLRSRKSGVKMGHGVYVLVRDSGPKAPILRTDGKTYDRNSGEIHDGGIMQ